MTEHVLRRNFGALLESELLEFKVPKICLATACVLNREGLIFCDCQNLTSRVQCPTYRRGALRSAVFCTTYLTQ